MDMILRWFYVRTCPASGWRVSQEHPFTWAPSNDPEIGLRVNVQYNTEIEHWTPKLPIWFSMDILFQTQFFSLDPIFTHQVLTQKCCFQLSCFDIKNLFEQKTQSKTNSMIERKNTKTLNNHNQSFIKENESFHQALLLVFTIFS